MSKICGEGTSYVLAGFCIRPALALKSSVDPLPHHASNGPEPIPNNVARSLSNPFFLTTKSNPNHPCMIVDFTLALPVLTLLIMPQCEAWN